MPHAKAQTRPSGRTDPCGDVCYVGFGDMVNYLKKLCGETVVAAATGSDGHHIVGSLFAAATI